MQKKHLIKSKTLSWLKTFSKLWNEGNFVNLIKGFCEIRIRKEEVRGTHMCEPSHSTFSSQLLELLDKFCKVAELKIKIKNSIVFIYNSSKYSEMKWRKLYLQYHKKNKILRNILTKEVQHMYNKSYENVKKTNDLSKLRHHTHQLEDFILRMQYSWSFYIFNTIPIKITLLFCRNWGDSKINMKMQELT